MNINEEHLEILVADRRLIATLMDGHWYLPFDQTCDLLSLSPDEQAQSFLGHPIANTRSSVNERGKLTVRLDTLAFWLTTVALNHVSDPVTRHGIATLQAEAALVLHEAFMAGRLTEQPALSNLLKQNTPTTRIYHEAVTLVGLARAHLLQEAGHQPGDIDIKLIDDRFQQE